MAVATPDAPTAAAPEAKVIKATDAEARAAVQAVTVQPERLNEKMDSRLSTHKKDVAVKTAEDIAGGKGLEAIKTMASGFKRKEWPATLDGITDTGTGRSEDATNKAAVAEQMRVYTEFLTKGINNMPAPDRAKLYGQTRKILQDNPFLQDALANSAGNIDDMTLNSLLGKSEFQRFLADNLNGKFDPENVNKVKALEQQLGIQKTELTKAQSSLTATEQKIASIHSADADRNTFDNNSYNSLSMAGETGSRAEILQKLSQGLQTSTSGDPRITGLESNLNEFQLLAKRAESGATLNPRELKRQADLQTLIDQAKGHPSEGAKVREFIDLRTQNADINARLTQKGELPGLQDQRNAYVAEIDRINKDIATAESQRTAVSDGMAQEVQDSLGEALDDYYTKAVADYISVFREGEGNIGSELATKYQDAMKNALDKRWTKEMTKRKLFGQEKVTKLNKDQISSDFKNLLADGPDALVTDVLAGLPDGDREALKNNPDYMNTIRTQAAEKTMAADIGAGNKVTEEQIRILSLRSYGETAMQNMLAHNEKVKSYIEQAIGGSVFDKGSINKIKDKLSNKGLFSLLALGIIGTVTGAISVAKGAGEVGITTG